MTFTRPSTEAASVGGVIRTSRPHPREGSPNCAGRGRDANYLAPPAHALPDIPTVGEFLPGYEASIWYGVGVPTGTPAEIIGELNKEINTALADPTFKARLADVGGSALSGSPADFGRLIAAETEKWGKVIRAANIKPE